MHTLYARHCYIVQTKLYISVNNSWRFGRKPLFRKCYCLCNKIYLYQTFSSNISKPSLPWTPRDLTILFDFYSAIVGGHVVKIGNLNVEEKRVWQPDNISIRSGQENRLIKGVVQSWVMPVLTEEDIHRKILQGQINSFLSHEKRLCVPEGTFPLVDITQT